MTEDYKERYHSMIKLSTKSLNEKNDTINMLKNETKQLKEKCQNFKERIIGYENQVVALEKEIDFSKNTKYDNPKTENGNKTVKPNAGVFIVKIIIILFSLYGFIIGTMQIIDYSKNIVKDVSTKDHIKNLYNDDSKVNE